MSGGTMSISVEATDCTKPFTIMRDITAAVFIPGAVRPTVSGSPDRRKKESRVTLSASRRLNLGNNFSEPEEDELKER